MESLSIVIPVYNSETTIERLSRALILQYAGSYDLELILVNDYSLDGSDGVCRALQAEFEEIVTYIKLARNFGEHNAVMAGLNHSKGEYIVIMDDDFQNPPEEVAKLVDECRKGYDVVYCRYTEKKDTFFRNFVSYLNSIMAQQVLKKPAGLYLSSFKVMNRFLARELIKFEGSDPYIDALVLRTTSNIGIIDTRHDIRLQGRSGYTMKKLIALWGNMIVTYSLVPLRILGLLGTIMTLIGIYHISRSFIYDIHPLLEDPTDIEWLTSVSVFFRGFNLLAISIVGEYVGRIYLNINRDPQFIVREIVSKGSSLKQDKYFP